MILKSTRDRVPLFPVREYRKTLGGVDDKFTRD